MGEKFDVSAATGTGNFELPVPLSQARMTPQMNLKYDTGAGNGIFGFGWTLDLPVIRRKTDKGLPRYDDEGESDVFLLSGVEDLMPVLDAAGERVTRRRTVFGIDYVVTLYRPRIEGLFSRIERWRVLESGISHWRSITRDNIFTLYGYDTGSRVVDPADSTHVFEWRISRTWDLKGNVVDYTWAHEDGAGIDSGNAHEANRNAGARRAQSYLRKVQYGNRTRYAINFTAAAEPALPSNWMFTLALDYGDHAAAGLDPDTTWPLRPDPFSSFRSSFEVRTYRRVQRLLMFNHFSNELSLPVSGLVRSLDCVYSDQQNSPDPRAPIYTFLVSLTQTAYRQDGTALRTKGLPPLVFAYSQATIDPTVRSIDRNSLGNLPEGVDATRFRWLDLDGEGLAGILSQTPGTWYYKRNLSAANLLEDTAGDAVPRPLFGPLEALASVPGHSDLAGRQLMALDGDGMVDLIDFTADEPGFYARLPGRNFGPLKRFSWLPQIDWSDPNLKFIDLTGDGLTDILVSEDGVFTWYTGLGSEGFGIGQCVRVPWDERKGPTIVFADGTDTIFVADMSGDGLNDIVRVRNGETCYWPNIGYGRFGSKVTMDRAPRFDSEDAFEARRIRLADIDGSGSADILYIGRDGVRAWFNQSGNAFSGATLVAIFPDADMLENVQTADLLGTGTACLVWSSPMPASSASPMRYVDLMGGVKPHLLTNVRNNLGAETRITYAPSTRYYLEDEAQGRPWVTRLPFPTWCVARVETLDWIGRHRLVSRYAWHHGFFDGLEREFRGFGMVEQWDTEELRTDIAFADGDFVNWDAASWSPPTLKRSWFSTGAFIQAGAVTREYESEYWLEPQLRGPPAASGAAAMRPPDSTLPEGLTPFEMREAYRALKGRALRVELFAADDSGPIGAPYSVEESNFTVERLQPQGPNLHAVFLVQARESIALHYERANADPRVTHEVVLETNPYGDVLRALSIDYPRRAGATPEPTLDAATQARLAYDQGRLHLRATANGYTAAIDDIALSPDSYLAPRPSSQEVAEITGVEPSDKGFGTASLFAFEELDATGGTPGLWQKAWSGAYDLPYEAIPAADIDGSGPAAATASLARRFIAHTRIQYRSDDLTTLLPVGQSQSMAIVGQTFKAAFTPGLASQVFGTRAPAALFNEGGYVQLSGESGWWVPSARSYFSPGDNDTPALELAYAQAHFYQPARSVDPFGAIARVAYDVDDLLAVRMTDPVNNTTICTNDYRMLAPVLVVDPNGNQSAVVFDTLGMVTATAVMGKTTENLGDALTGFSVDLDDATLGAFFANPLADPAALIGSATTRVIADPAAYQRTQAGPSPSPPAVAVISRESHSKDPARPRDDGAVLACQFAFAYNDGLGRVVQHKASAAPGPLNEGGAPVSPRWLGTGWTIFNNKGKPVRQYEPFFSATNSFEFAAQTGVSTVVFYDPAGRVVARLHPDASWDKRVFSAWRQDRWDGNDTVQIDDPRTDADVGTYFQRALPAGTFASWRTARIGGDFGTDAESKAAQQDAALKATVHAATPVVEHADALGRTCLTIVDNGAGARYPARPSLDTEGKPLTVIDALGRRTQEFVLRSAQAGGGFQYVAGTDMAGTPLYHINADAGARTMFSDVAGKPIRVWDARGQVFRMIYDLARRATHRFVSVNGAAEILLELSIYGEGQPAANLCGRRFRHYDGAGYAENSAYDFKGNRVSARRQLAVSYRSSPDWTPLMNLSKASDLDAAAITAGLVPTGDAGRDNFVSSVMYDALNRPVQSISPANAAMRPNVTQHGYDAGGQLTRVDVWLQQAAAPAALLDPTTADRHAVTAITYNPRGQRASIAYGNGVFTTYGYDRLTFRLTQLTSTRPGSFPGNQQTVQLLRYFYDPVGNVTRLRDDADTQNVVYFQNQRVEPSADYTYDPLYRLVTASGREHLGQTNGALNAAPPVTDDDSFRMRLPQPGDGNAMGTYVETYGYDALGNLLTVAHKVASGGWTSQYTYNESSCIVANETGNRLSTTRLPGDPAAGPYSGSYSYDAHGNTVRMTSLPTMVWSEDDTLRATARTIMGAGTPATTYYAYDAGGARVRKITDRQTAAGAAPAPTAERIYLGGVEVYREYASDGTTLTLIRETLPVMGGERADLRVETRTLGNDPAPPEQVRYQFTNHLGSAALELGDAAEVISYEEYFPFGSTSYQAVAQQTDVARRYRYTGKERDEENGLYYHGARYYASWLGRWMSCDPSGIAREIDLYTYANNNPVVLFDPAGTDAVAPSINTPPPPQAAQPTVEDVLKAPPQSYHWGGRLQDRPPTDSLSQDAPATPAVTGASPGKPDEPSSASDAPSDDDDTGVNNASLYGSTANPVTTPGHGVSNKEAWAAAVLDPTTRAWSFQPHFAGFYGLTSNIAVGADVLGTITGDTSRGASFGFTARLGTSHKISSFISHFGLVSTVRININVDSGVTSSANFTAIYSQPLPKDFQLDINLSFNPSAGNASMSAIGQLSKQNLTIFGVSDFTLAVEGGATRYAHVPTDKVLPFVGLGIQRDITEKVTQPAGAGAIPLPPPERKQWSVYLEGIPGPHPAVSLVGGLAWGGKGFLF
jgi:RHS repeat-associated protein